MHLVGIEDSKYSLPLEADKETACKGILYFAHVLPPSPNSNSPNETDLHAILLPDSSEQARQQSSAHVKELFSHIYLRTAQGEHIVLAVNPGSALP